MHIRDATIDDIPRLTELWLAASGTHSAFDILFPCRIEAPEDFRLMIAEDILDSFLQGEERYLVVETETEQRRVVAWASWTRMGSSNAAAKIGAQSDSVLKVLERRLRGLEEALRYPFKRMFQMYQKSHTRSSYARYEGLVLSQFRKRVWVGDIEEHWYFRKLSVDPRWKQQGIGMMLLQWGLDRAQEEGVVVGLESTEEGMDWFQKAGFVQVELDGTNWFQRVGFEQVVLEGMDGIDDLRYPVLVWRPETRE